jgi:Integrase core domain
VLPERHLPQICPKACDEKAGFIKTECLDGMIFFGEASFRHAVTEYIEHYHHERPHQSRGNVILFPDSPLDAIPRDGPVISQHRLDGLLKYYRRKAA